MRMVPAVFAAMCAAFSAPAALAGGEIAYALERSGEGLPRLFTFDPTSAQLLSSVDVSLPGYEIGTGNGLARHPATGVLFALLRGPLVADGVIANYFVTIDPATGEASLIGELGQRFAGLAFTPAGALYGVTGQNANADSSLFLIDPATGATTHVTGLGHGDDGEALAVDAAGRLVHASGSNPGSAYLERLNLAGTGGITDILTSHEFSFSDEVRSLGYSATLGEMYLTAGNSFYRVDPANGDAVFLGDIQITIKGLAFDGATLYALNTFRGGLTTHSLYTLNTANASILTDTPLVYTGPGDGINGTNGLARDPVSGALFAVVSISRSSGSHRVLATINPATGAVDVRGDLGRNFAGIAFRADGTLIGVTGDGDERGEALYTINTATAQSTFLRDLGNGADGEAIAIGPGGLLYHASGVESGDQFFEAVDLTVAVPPLTTDILVGGSPGHTWQFNSEVLSATWSDAQQAFLVAPRDGMLYAVSGAPATSTLLGVNDLYFKGLAFVGPTLYGLTNPFASGVDLALHRLDPLSGQSLGAIAVTHPSLALTGTTGMARNPIDGLLYAIVFESSSERHLVTLDPISGVCSDIGILDRRFAGLAFRADGTLYGVTGDGDETDPESLYTIDTSTAASAFVLQFGNGADGETIAIGADGFLYHASGISIGDQYWERVDLTTLEVTDLGIALPAHSSLWDDPLALSHSFVHGSLFLSDSEGSLYSINETTGESVFVGTFEAADGVSGLHMKGLAFVSTAAPCPGDTNGDGVIDFFDLNNVLSSFGIASGEPGYLPGADLNNDNVVDFLDLNIVLSFFGTAC